MCKVISAQDFFEMYRTDTKKSSSEDGRSTSVHAVKLDPSVYWMV